MEKICKNCKWWDEEADYHSDMGHCRRFPPLLCEQNATNWSKASFPETKENDWCGEFRKKQDD